jgi:hypothetical protein
MKSIRVDSILFSTLSLAFKKNFVLIAEKSMELFMKK